MSNSKTPNQEIERKFLVDLNKWKPTNKGTHILQFYLSDKPTVRVRIAGIQGFITVKGQTEGVTRAEFEYEIPVDDALDMIKLAIYIPIEKTRYDVVYNDQLFTVDVFEGKNEGLVVAEIELDSEDKKIDLPGWITEEVSYDANYYNSNLSKSPFTEWNRSGFKFRSTHSK